MKKLKLEELQRTDIKGYKKLKKLPFVVILDNLRSGTNVGSFFRTSDAYLVETIYLTGITASPPHKEITKTAIGATSSVNWIYNESILDCCTSLKQQGYKLYGVEQTNQSISIKTMELDRLGKSAFIFGNEVMGISEEILPLIDCAIEIPQHGTKHSLNVAVCGGIVIWEVYKKLL